MVGPPTTTQEWSITLTIYDNWQQTSHRTFPMRNVAGRTEDEQIAFVRQIMDDVAMELHHITSLGIDKGVIRIGGKKVDENLYPQLTPAEGVKYFLFGVNITFFPVFTYQWIRTDNPGEEWEQHKREYKKKASFRLPIHAAHSKEEDHFFTYVRALKRRRKVKRWLPKYDPTDSLFSRFMERFYENGHLCIGKRHFWGTLSHPAQISGVFWAPPNFGSSKVPRKSRLASQPADDTDYVYLIHMGRTKMYKIGKTNDPQGRLASLQTASPYKLKLLHTFRADNATAAEEALHARFHQTRLEGEWFKLSDEECQRILALTGFENHRFYIGGNGLTIDELFTT